MNAEDRYLSRERMLHDLDEEEARLGREHDELREVVARIATVDGDIARVILDTPAIRSQVIDPLREEAARLGRLALEKDDMTPSDREAHVLARRILIKFLGRLEFRKVEREGYFTKLWKELLNHVRGNDA